MEKVLYEELFPDEFAERIKKMPVAFLPLGTLEWHGPHMPLGADGIQSKELFIELAGKMGGVVLPMLFVGPDRVFDDRGELFYGMDINTSGALKSYPAQRLTGSAYWLDTELFKKLLMSIVEQLSRTGVKIIIGHGHGPSINAFANIAADAQKMYGVKLYTAWSFAENEELTFQNDHAGANETSIVMAFRPDLVDFSRVKEDESNLIGIAGRHPVKESSAEYGKRIKEYTIECIYAGLRSEYPQLFEE